MGRLLHDGPMSTPHPRLADHAVLLRRGSAIQIGSTPDRALVIDDPPEGLFEFLATLDGHCSADTVAERARHVPGLDWLRLHQVLRDHGLLAEPEPSRPLRAHVVAGGDWGLQVAELLLSAGATHVGLSLLADEPGLHRRAHLLSLRHRGRLFVRTQFQPQRHDDLIAIINTETAETDRAITAACSRQDIPHLVVRPTGEGMVVGPLVVPGVGPCLNCLDLHARGIDPQWPSLLMQLSRIRLPVPELAARWAAGTAVTELIGFRHSGHSSLLGRTATVAAPHWTPQWRTWRAHPGCLCHWDGVDVAGLMIAA